MRASLLFWRRHTLQSWSRVTPCTDAIAGITAVPGKRLREIFAVQATRLKWRRTALTRADGSPGADDWTLVNDQGQLVGRIYRMAGGPTDGQWFWTVLIDAHGRPWNGGTGHCPTGREAKEAVEARVSPGSGGGGSLAVDGRNLPKLLDDCGMDLQPRRGPSI